MHVCQAYKERSALYSSYIPAELAAALDRLSGAQSRQSMRSAQFDEGLLRVRCCAATGIAVKLHL